MLPQIRHCFDQTLRARHLKWPDSAGLPAPCPKHPVLQHCLLCDRLGKTAEWVLGYLQNCGTKKKLSEVPSPLRLTAKTIDGAQDPLKTQCSEVVYYIRPHFIHRLWFFPFKFIFLVTELVMHLRGLYWAFRSYCNANVNSVQTGACVNPNTPAEYLKTHKGIDVK